MTFVAVDGQSFSSYQDWVNRATRRLTSHPRYHNTEHDGPAKGWRGEHFTTMCFDQLGRRVRNGGDFQRAEDDNAYPVWWVWPDQIAELIMQPKHAAVAAEFARMQASAAEVKEEGDGYWTPCSGCTESVDGYLSEKLYPTSELFGCQQGGGCGDCGGVGVVWNHAWTDEDIRIALES